VTTNLPVKVIPKSTLRIQGDPTLWGMRDLPPTKPTWGETPVELATIGPLTGTMVLAPGQAGSVAVNPPLPGDGWMPALQFVFPYLYVPTTTGVHSNSVFYELAADTDIATLAGEIATAMVNGSILVVDFISVGKPAFLRLNGKQLPFAVLGTSG
jgi:hypothetical protein